MEKPTIPLSIIPLALLIVAIAIVNNILHLYAITTNSTVSTHTSTCASTQDIVKDLLDHFRIEEIRQEGQCLRGRGQLITHNIVANVYFVQCNRTVIVTAIAELP